MSPPSENIAATTAELNIYQSLGLGALSGALAPLSNTAVTAFGGTGDVKLSTVPWILTLLFAFLGAVVAACLADGVEKHVFTYGLAAPFMVMSFIKSKDAADHKQASALTSENNSIVRDQYRELAAEKNPQILANGETPR